MSDSQNPPPPQRILDANGKEIPAVSAVIPRFERWAKILSLPFTLGLLGIWGQWQISQVAVAKDYVAIATSVLRDPNTKVQSPQLRNWAVDLLVKYSAVKISDSLKDELRSGSVSLPSAETVPSLLGEMRALIKQSQIQQRASLLGITLPMANSENLRSTLKRLSTGNDPKTKELADSLIKDLDNPPDISIENN